MTYSIGMRAPEFADLSPGLSDDRSENVFYTDPDLAIDEALPGYISARAIERARELISDNGDAGDRTALALGRCVTTTKQWLTPDTMSTDDAEHVLAGVRDGGRLEVHGMSRIAFDENHVFVNGRSRALSPETTPVVERICRTREFRGPVPDDREVVGLLMWMLETGALEVNGKF
jgi:ribosomal protein L16 Arg81 hydroxylase